MLFINKIVLTRIHDNKQAYSIYIIIENLNNEIKRS